MEKNSRNELSFLEIKLEKLNDKLADLQKELKITKERLHEQENEHLKLRLLLDHYENPKDDYKKCGTWVSKIVFIIAKENKPLRSAEIIALLLRREPMIDKKISKEKFISPSLNSAIRSQRLIPYKVKGVRGNYYCLPEWINKEGELLPEMSGKVY